MYPVTHATIAVGAVKAGERLFPARWLPFDYRFVVVGAVLPDLIDKPLRLLDFGVPHGHTYAHTLLFSLLVIICGSLIIRRSGDARVLLLGLGSLSHPLVDPVIVYPRTLFWPLFGLDFADSRGIPGAYLLIIDAALVAVLALALVRSRALRTRAAAFARTGEL
jgi:membrane-bound metal-dependent hydrolase YbcI (DUF457 family)